MTATPTVRVGSIWADNDRRAAGRKVRVVEVDDTHATVEQVDSRAHDRGHPGRRTRIRLDRFRPTSTGYRLVTDAPAEPARADELLKLWQAGRRMGEDRG